MRFFHSVHSKDENIAAICDLFLDRVFVSAEKSWRLNFRVDETWWRILIKAAAITVKLIR